MINFQEINSCELLIKAIRPRYQMWARGSYELYGILTGATLVKDFDFSHVVAFKEYTESIFHQNGYLPELIKQKCKHQSSEIPLFFELYEKFSRCTCKTELLYAVKKVKTELHDFHLHPAYLYIPAPRFLALSNIENWGMFLLFLDENKNRFYEAVMHDYDYAKEYILRNYIVDEI